MAGEDLNETVNLVDLGKKARRAVYINYLRRMGAGETLSAADVRAMQALEAELTAGNSEQSEAPQPTQIPTVVANLLRATEYLQSQGWQVQKSTLYNHRKMGLLSANPSGAFDIAELDRYAAANLTRAAGPTSDPDDPARVRLETLQAEKLETSNKIAQEQLRVLARKNMDFDKEIDSRVGKELVKREAFFKNYLVNFFTSEAPAIVEKIHGDPQLIPEFIDTLQRGLNMALGSLTRYRDMDIKLTPEGEVTTP